MNYDLLLVADSLMDNGLVIALVLVVAFVMFLVFASVLWRFGSLWIQGMASGVNILSFDSLS